MAEALPEPNALWIRPSFPVPTVVRVVKVTADQVWVKFAGRRSREYGLQVAEFLSKFKPHNGGANA